MEYGLDGVGFRGSMV